MTTFEITIDDLAGGTTYQPSVKKEMRWGYWTQMKAEEALSHLKNVVFPVLVELADEKSSFGDASRMKGAQCKINKAGLLIEACNLIDQMKIAEQNQDVQGDTSAGSVQVCMSICWVTCSLQGAVARAVVEPSRDIESLRGRMGASQSARQVEGLFESLLNPSFRP